jgi:protein TonB
MSHAIRLQAGTTRAQTGATRPGTLRIKRLDFNRIAAEAGTIAINGVLLLLLLVPMTPGPAPIAESKDDPWIIPITPPKPPPKPEVVEVTKRHATTPTPTIIERPIDVPPIVVPDPTPMDIAIEPTTELVATATTATSIGLGKPLTGAHLEYQNAPPPSYPHDAVREGLMGTVLLRVLVDIDGKPLDVQIERSSGHRSLDLAARRQVLARWKFRPAMQDGQAVQAIGLVPVEFALNR